MSVAEFARGCRWGTLHNAIVENVFLYNFFYKFYQHKHTIVLCLILLCVHDFLFFCCCEQLVKAELKREVEEAKPVSDPIDLVNSDDDNDEEEFDAWKNREIKRIKKYRDEKEAYVCLMKTIVQIKTIV